MPVKVRHGRYVRGVQTSAAGAAVLTARLAHALPPDASPRELERFARVRERAEEVRAVAAARDSAGTLPIRARFDALGVAWRALHQTLGGIAQLPADLSDRGVRATVLLETLFPDGAGFTRLSAEDAWSEAQRRLKLLERERLGDDLAAIAGADFLAAVRTSTAGLAEAIGTGDAPYVRTRSTAMKEALVKYSRAVAAYGRALIERYDETDPASVARLLAAAGPLDEHRAQRRERGRRRSGEAAMDPQ